MTVEGERKWSTLVKFSNNQPDYKIPLTFNFSFVMKVAAVLVRNQRNCSTQAKNSQMKSQELLMHHVEQQKDEEMVWHLVRRDSTSNPNV